jgi:hypothetical protein
MILFIDIIGKTKNMHILSLSIGALIILIWTNQGQAANDTAVAEAERFLAQVNLTIPPSGKGYQWISLCQIKTEAINAIGENHDTKACTYTAHGDIKQTQVKENGPISRCSYSNEFYASGTMLSYENTIADQYDAAIKLAGEAKYEAAVELIQSMKTEHMQNLRVAANKDSARLTATASSAAWFGGGGNCDLILEGLVNELF